MGTHRVVYQFQKEDRTWATFIGPAVTEAEATFHVSRERERGKPGVRANVLTVEECLNRYGKSGD